MASSGAAAPTLPTVMKRTSSGTRASSLAATASPVITIVESQDGDDGDESTASASGQSAARSAATRTAADAYEVEAVRDTRIVGRGKRQYLVKWLGFDESENTWEDEKRLAGAAEAIAAFYHPAAESSSSSSSSSRKAKRDSNGTAAESPRVPAIELPPFHSSSPAVRLSSSSSSSSHAHAQSPAYSTAANTPAAGNSTPLSAHWLASSSSSKPSVPYREFVAIPEIADVDAEAADALDAGGARGASFTVAGGGENVSVLESFRSLLDEFTAAVEDKRALLSLICFSFFYCFSAVRRFAHILRVSR